MKNHLCVTYQSENLHPLAEQLSSQHQLGCHADGKGSTDLALNFTEQYLELRDLTANTGIHVDFLAGALAHRRKYGGGRGQTLARAIGMKQGKPIPSVIDATAGLAKDAYVLATLGCPVTLIERSFAVAALVDDAIQRAAVDSDFNTLLTRGFKLVQDNAIEYLSRLTSDQQVDVIYLDPMYPERKKSSQVKKNMQILQKLLGQDMDTQDLLEQALKAARKRVVVKRPRGAETINSTQPTLCYESKNTRYDVYVITAI
ncbi:MAG: class I SAM-dependent methyltransferase [Gammaproteobacteria bacterium]|nr:class I SAM-dependent methyltransferase [Gammaproteobacteria bacterium]